jgi:Holliday junction resolvasome RuvABC endonuclease subunit
MRILAIDPGTKCGWAANLDGVIVSGTWNLKGGRFDGAGMRFVRLEECLCEFAKVERVCFEEVRRHLGTDAAHIYGGITAVIMAFCERRGIPYEGIPVGTIKKHATGKGNADKAKMTETARERWPDQNIKDDNQADALWLLDVVTAPATAREEV